MYLNEIIKDKREKILEIAKNHGAQAVRVFGSVVRGQSTASSDIDFLITLKSGSTLLDIVAIKQDLEEFLGCKVDVVTEKSLSPYIRESVLKEAVNL